jgi:endonuclease/exonuclease/phosphatase family metal-dependent hydrolase
MTTRLWRLLLVLALASAVLLQSCGGESVAQEQTAVPTMARAQKQLKVLTNNVYFLPTFSMKINERIPCVSELIATYDVVALQEVFDEDAQNRLVRDWYQHFGLSSTLDLQKSILDQKALVGGDVRVTDKEAYIVADTYFVLGPDTKGLVGSIKQDGGLLILSHYPILKSSGFVFSRCSGVDCGANKGAIYARIQIGTSADDYIHVFNTHTQADEGNREVRKRQIEELRKFMELAMADDFWATGEVVHPVLLLGDLNVSGQDLTAEEYLDMLRLLQTPIAMVDLWEEANSTAGILRDPGYTWVGHDRVPPVTPTPDSPDDAYVRRFWGAAGNVLASDSGSAERFDYVLLGGGLEQYSLIMNSMQAVPSLREGLQYCLDEQRARYLADLPEQLRTAIMDKLPSGMPGFYLSHLDETTAQALQGFFQKLGYALSDEAHFRRDGDEIRVDNQEPDLYFTLRYDAQKLYRDWRAVPDTCWQLAEGETCAYVSRSVSDHLGISVEFVYTYPLRAPRATPEVTPEPPILPTQQPTGGEATCAGEGWVKVMRAVNARQVAISVPQSDWGLGGTPDGGMAYPALDALGSDCDAASISASLQGAIGGLVSSGRFWNAGAAAPFASLAEFGQEGWPCQQDAPGCAAEMRAILESLDTIIFTAVGTPPLAKYPQPGGIYPTWPEEEVAGWDLEGLWAGMLENAPVVESGRGVLVSRHLDHVHPYVWLMRSYLGFDTASLADAPPVAAAWLRLLREKAFTAHYSVDDAQAVKEGPPAFTLQIDAGVWNSVAEEGDGWGAGPAEWNYLQGAAQRGWDSCPFAAGTLVVEPVDSLPFYDQVEIAPQAVAAGRQTQFKLHLADEAYPGAPGVRFVFEDTYQLQGSMANHLLLVKLSFPALP